MAQHYVIGVDVGTASVRAGVFDLAGKLRASAVEPIQIFRPQENFAEQSSEDIWEQTGKVVRRAVADAGVKAEDVIGISYDATCSLVALDRDNQPITISPTGSRAQNIVMWMDHRAIGIADEINAQGHDVLKYVGGKISPEMEPPKLKWIKQNLPDTWRNVGKFFDLADFMVYQSSGVDVRSLCTVVCKWGYLGHEGEFGRWDRSFYEQIGLADLFDGGKVTDDVRPMGTFAGNLTPATARHLGLHEGVAVGVGIIDAHAGGVGVLGAVWEGEDGTPLEKLETALALIGGTSSCHMAVSREPRFIPGVWGPYFGAMLPGMWLTEGGQSATGGLIDYVISDNAQAAALQAQAQQSGCSVYEILNDIVQHHTPRWTKDLHVLDYHHGNRSPKADPHAKGVVDGLTLDTSLESVAKRYYATIQACAYGTRDIIEAMNAAGYRIERIFATGGGTKNPVWLQEHADITGCAIVLAQEAEAVMLGSAILAAVAAGAFPNIPAAMKAMSHAGAVIQPNPAHAEYHQAKFEIYREMYEEQLRRRARMARF
ncbi:MAG: FGGY-family carbohydrate kinase [Abditibacteriales bacterium]|nr:FGGY-family carbohydrate kinase [Abditibacteriales bacterium]MDW8367524.1 FGGY-family carbohydrate kinase [Abditibacteriales bacterium]